MLQLKTLIASKT